MSTVVWYTCLNNMEEKRNLRKTVVSHRRGKRDPQQEHYKFQNSNRKETANTANKYRPTVTRSCRQLQNPKGFQGSKEAIPERREHVMIIDMKSRDTTKHETKSVDLVGEIVKQMDNTKVEMGRTCSRENSEKGESKYELRSLSRIKDLKKCVNSSDNLAPNVNLMEKESHRFPSAPSGSIKMKFKRKMNNELSLKKGKYDEYFVKTDICDSAKDTKTNLDSGITCLHLNSKEFKTSLGLQQPCVSVSNDISDFQVNFINKERYIYEKQEKCQAMSKEPKHNIKLIPKDQTQLMDHTNERMLEFSRLKTHCNNGHIDDGLCGTKYDGQKCKKCINHSVLIRLSPKENNNTVGKDCQGKLSENFETLGNRYVCRQHNGEHVNRTTPCHDIHFSQDINDVVNSSTKMSDKLKFDSETSDVKVSLDEMKVDNCPKNINSKFTGVNDNRYAHYMKKNEESPTFHQSKTSIEQCFNWKLKNQLSFETISKHGNVFDKEVEKSLSRVREKARMEHRNSKNERSQNIHCKTCSGEDPNLSKSFCKSLHVILKDEMSSCKMGIVDKYQIGQRKRKSERLSLAEKQAHKCIRLCRSQSSDRGMYSCESAYIETTQGAKMSSRNCRTDNGIKPVQTSLEIKEAEDGSFIVVDKCGSEQMDRNNNYLLQKLPCNEDMLSSTKIPIVILKDVMREKKILNDNKDEANDKVYILKTHQNLNSLSAAQKLRRKIRRSKRVKQLVQNTTDKHHIVVPLKRIYPKKRKNKDFAVRSSLPLKKRKLEEIGCGLHEKSILRQYVIGNQNERRSTGSIFQDKFCKNNDIEDRGSFDQTSKKEIMSNKKDLYQGSLQTSMINVDSSVIIERGQVIPFNNSKLRDMHITYSNKDTGIKDNHSCKSKKRRDDANENTETPKEIEADSGTIVNCVVGTKIGECYECGSDTEEHRFSESNDSNNESVSGILENKTNSIYKHTFGEISHYYEGDGYSKNNGKTRKSNENYDAEACRTKDSETRTVADTKKVSIDIADNEIDEISIERICKTADFKYDTNNNQGTSKIASCEIKNHESTSEKALGIRKLEIRKCLENRIIDSNVECKAKDPKVEHKTKDPEVEQNRLKIKSKDSQNEYKSKDSQVKNKTKKIKYKPKALQDEHEHTDSQDEYKPIDSQDEYKMKDSCVEHNAKDTPVECKAKNSQDEYKPKESQDKCNSKESQDEYKTIDSQDRYRTKDLQDEYNAKDSLGDCKYKDSQDKYNAKESQDEYETKDSQNVYKAKDFQDEYKTKDSQVEYKDSKVAYKLKESQDDFKPKDSQVEYKANDSKVENKSKGFNIEYKAKDLQIDYKTKDSQVENKIKDSKVAYKPKESQDDFKPKDLQDDYKTEDSKIEYKPKGLNIEYTAKDLKTEFQTKDSKVGYKTKGYKTSRNQNKPKVSKGEYKVNDPKMENKYSDSKLGDKMKVSKDLKTEYNSEDKEHEYTHNRTIEKYFTSNTVVHIGAEFSKTELLRINENKEIDRKRVSKTGDNGTNASKENMDEIATDLQIVKHKKKDDVKVLKPIKETNEHDGKEIYKTASYKRLKDKENLYTIDSSEKLKLNEKLCEGNTLTADSRIKRHNGNGQDTSKAEKKKKEVKPKELKMRNITKKCKRAKTKADKLKNCNTAEKQNVMRKVLSAEKEMVSKLKKSKDKSHNFIEDKDEAIKDVNMVVEKEKESNHKGRLQNCETSFQTLAALKVHEKTSHKNMKKNTDKLNKKEMILCHKGTLHTCQQCETTFETLAELKAHRKRSHPNTCGTCGLIFFDKATKTQHYWTHFKQTFNCIQCNRRFKSQTMYNSHLKTLQHAKVAMKTKKKELKRKEEELLQAVASIQEFHVQGDEQPMEPEPFQAFDDMSLVTDQPSDAWHHQGCYNNSTLPPNGNLVNNYTSTLTHNYNGTLTHNYNDTLTHNYNGTLTNNYNGTFTNNYNGTLTNNDNDTFTNSYNRTLTNYCNGTLANNYNCTLANNSIGTLTNNSNSTLTNNSHSTITNNSHSTLTNNSKSTLTNNSNSTLTNNHKSTLTNNYKSMLTWTPLINDTDEDNSPFGTTNTSTNICEVNSYPSMASHVMYVDHAINYNSQSVATYIDQTIETTSYQEFIEAPYQKEWDQEGPYMNNRNSTMDLSQHPNDMTYRNTVVCHSNNLLDPQNEKFDFQTNFNQAHPQNYNAFENVQQPMLTYEYQGNNNLQSLLPASNMEPVSTTSQLHFTQL